MDQENSSTIPCLTNIQDIEIDTSRKRPLPRFTNIEEKSYLGRGLKDTQHGVLYQLHLLMLILWRAYEQKYDEFRLTSELPEAEKFDDIVFVSKNKNSKRESRLLQVNHTKKVITSKDLFTDKDGRFSLPKYFKSFTRINERCSTKSNHSVLSGSEIKDVIVITYAKYDDTDLKDCLEEIVEPDNLLGIPGNTELQVFKLKRKVLQEYRSKFENVSDFKELIKLLVDPKVKQIERTHKVFMEYYYALMRDVFEKDKKNMRFSEKFIDGTNLPKEVDKFRTHFLSSIKGINKQLKDFNWKITDGLAKEFQPEENPEIIDPAKFAQQFHDILKYFEKFGKLVEINEDNLAKVFQDSNGTRLSIGERKTFIGNIRNLGGHVLIRIFSEIRFSTSFIRSSDQENEECKKPKKTSDGLETFRLELKKLCVDFNSIDQYKFKIGFKEFQTCEEGALERKLPKPFSDDDLNDFLDKFKIIFNYPDQLDEILGNEIKEKHKSLDCTAFKSFCELHLHRWLAERMTKIYTPEKAKLVFDNIETDILSLELNGFNESYLANVPMKYQFNNIERIKEFLQDDSENRLDLQFEYFGLGPTRVVQTIQNLHENDSIEEIRKYTRRYGFIFLTMKQLDSNKFFKKISNVCEGKKMWNLLIIECEKDEVTKINEIYEDYKDYFIKMIFMTHTNGEKISSGFTDLTVKSQMNLYKNGKLKIDTEENEFNFSEAIDKMCLEELIDSETLHTFIVGESVKIENKIRDTDQQLDLYYMERYVARLEEKYSEDDFVKNAEPIVIVSDMAGGGKSSLLSSLSRKLVQYKKRVWLFRIDLNDHTKFLDDLKATNYTPEINAPDEMVQFLSDMLQSTMKSTFERNLFKHCLLKPSTLKLAFFFDGFDEISPDYKEIVLELLAQLQKSRDDFRVLVTTRPSMVDCLEKKLNLNAFEILPLSSGTVQIEFLTQVFINKFKHLQLSFDIERLKFFANALIEKQCYDIDDSEKVFTSNPLQLRMMADIFVEKCQSFLESKRNDVIECFPDKLDILDLYEKYIELKLKIYCTEKGQQKLSNLVIRDDQKKLRNLIETNHQYLALCEIFNSDQLSKLLSPEEIETANSFIEEVRNGKERRGLVDRVVNDKPYFVHRTFPKYFVASFLGNSLINGKKIDFFECFIQYIREEETLSVECMKNWLAENTIPETSLRKLKCAIYMCSTGTNFLEGVFQSECGTLIRFICNCCRSNKCNELLHFLVDYDNQLLLNYAQNIDVLKLLVENGYDIDKLRIVIHLQQTLKSHPGGIDLILEHTKPQNEVQKEMNMRYYLNEEVIFELNKKPFNFGQWLLKQKNVKYDEFNGIPLLHASSINMKSSSYNLEKGAERYSVSFDKLETCKGLLSSTIKDFTSGFDFHVRTRKGVTVLHWTATNCRGDHLQSGAYVEQHDFKFPVRVNVVEAAAACNQIDLLEWMLKPKENGGAGANVDKFREYIRDNIIVALQNKEFEFCQWLIVEEHLNVNSDQWEDMPLLHASFLHCDLEASKFLMKNGADLTAENKYGHNSLEFTASVDKCDEYKRTRLTNIQDIEMEASSSRKTQGGPANDASDSPKLKMNPASTSTIPCLTNIQDIKMDTSRMRPVPRFTNIEEKSYLVRGLKATQHGVLYQLHLLMLILWRAYVLKYFKFRLTSELTESGKLDDIVFLSKTESNSEWKSRSLQVKHTTDTKKVITIKDFFTEKEGDYDLPKYFKSFTKINERSNTKSNYSIFSESSIEDVILITNIRYDGNATNLKNCLEEIDIEPNKLLGIPGNTELKVFKLKRKVLQEHRSKFENVSDFKDLIKLLVDPKVKQIQKTHEVFMEYYYALMRDVLVFEKDKKNMRFSEKFIDGTNLPKEVDEFRTHFLSSIKGINKQLKDFNWKITDGLAKEFQPKENPEFIDPAKFAQQFHDILKYFEKLVKINEDNLVKVFHDSNGTSLSGGERKTFIANIRKLDDHVLIRKFSEIRFSTSFIRSSDQENEEEMNTLECKKPKKTPDGLETFRLELKKLCDEHKLVDFNSIDQYKFKIGLKEFQTCEEGALERKLPKPLSDDDFKDLIKLLVDPKVKQIEKTHKIFMEYYYALMRDVFEKDKKNMQFSKKFIDGTNLPKEVDEFRTHYLSSIIGINKKLENFNWKITDGLAKEFQPEENPEIVNPAKFAQQFHDILKYFEKLVEINEDNLAKVFQDSNGTRLSIGERETFIANIRNLGGHVLIRKFSEIRFSTSFIRSSDQKNEECKKPKKTPDGLETFRSELKKLCVNFNSIDQYKFKIGFKEFQTCEEGALERKLPKPFSDDDLNDFLDKFKIIFNYPDQLDEILGNEIKEKHQSLDCTAFKSFCELHLHRWLAERMTTFYTPEKAKVIFDNIETDILSLELNGFNESYLANVPMKYQFNNIERIKEFLQDDSENRLYLQFEYFVLGPTRVVQTLQNLHETDSVEEIRKYTRRYGFIFLTMKQLDTKKFFKKISNVCEGKKMWNLLIIECEKDEVTKINEIYEDYEDCFIKMIFMTHTNGEKISSGFIDLTDESQENLYKNGKLKIDTEENEFNFSEAIDKMCLEELVDAKTLHTLIVGDSVKIENKIRDADQQLDQYYMERYVARLEEKYSEDDFVKNAEPIVIVSDMAGGGKSSLLSSLCRKLVQYKERVWLFRIDLNDHTMFLDLKATNKYSINAPDAMVQFLSDMLQSTMKSTFERNLFKHCLLKPSTLKLAFFFDGFDEISPDYKEIVLDLLVQLQKRDLRVLVTTRPSMVDCLEKKLNLNAFEILPLSRGTDQIEFLTKFYINKFKISQFSRDIERLKSFANALIEKQCHDIDDSEKIFTSNPLQLRMMADVFVEKCQSFLNSRCNYVKECFPDKLDIFDLYEKYIELKLKIYCTEKGQQKLSNPAIINDEKRLWNLMEAQYQYLALCEIFSSRDLKKLLSPEEIKKAKSLIEEVRNGKERRGLVDRVVNNKPYFVHRSFAEYFVASFLVNSLINGKNAKIEFFECFIQYIGKKDILSAVDMKIWLEKKENTIPEPSLRKLKRAIFECRIGTEFLEAVVQSECNSLIKFICNCFPNGDSNVLELFFNPVGNLNFNFAQNFEVLNLLVKNGYDIDKLGFTINLQLILKSAEHKFGGWWSNLILEHDFREIKNMWYCYREEVIFELNKKTFNFVHWLLQQIHSKNVNYDSKSSNRILLLHANYFYRYSSTLNYCVTCAKATPYSVSFGKLESYKGLLNSTIADFAPDFDFHVRTRQGQTVMHWTATNCRGDEPYSGMQPGIFNEGGERGGRSAPLRSFRIENKEWHPFGFIIKGNVVEAAAACNRIDLLEWMLKPKENGGAGANVDKFREYIRDNIIVVLQNKEFEFCQWLIDEKHLNVNSDKWEDMPLLHASFLHCDLEVSIFLVKNGADLYAINKDGHNALEIAASIEKLEIREWFQTFLDDRFGVDIHMEA